MTHSHTLFRYILIHIRMDKVQGSKKKSPSMSVPDYRQLSKTSIAHISRKFRYKMNKRRKHDPLPYIISIHFDTYSNGQSSRFEEEISINVSARLSATVENVDRSYFAEISIQNE